MDFYFLKDYKNTMPLNIEPLTRVQWKPHFTIIIYSYYWHLKNFIYLMKIAMNNNIYELVKSHLCIIDKNLQNVKCPIATDKTVDWIFQLDFLAWYVDSIKLDLYWLPYENDLGIKDNPNRIPTEYENIFKKVEYHWENISVDYQLVLPNHSPIAILNRWYFKVRKWKSYEYRWRISVYWKALKLYYKWYIPRLKNYIIRYSWECCRSDLCWDFPCKIPNWIIDLNISWTNHTTTYFWEKRSPIFFRIYDKTQDLKREKNCFAWLYDKFYVKECWRIECQLSGDYSRSMSPIDWLDIVEVDKSKIQKLDSINRNVYKSALYGVINTVDWINLSPQEKIEILTNSKKLLENKIKKISDSIY